MDNLENLRHEHKYYINTFQYLSLRNRLSAALQPDPFADHEGQYHIRSLYFDDMYNSGLAEKLSGLWERSKYRIRIYNLEDKVIKLERKGKVGQFTQKESARISREDVNLMKNGQVSFMMKSENPLMKKFYMEVRNRLLRPVVLVDYVREAYVHPAGNVRITFDMELSTGLHSTDLFNPGVFTLRAIEEPLLIMEVKYDHLLPGFIRDILQESIPQKTAISKYAICRKYTKMNSWEDN